MNSSSCVRNLFILLQTNNYWQFPVRFRLTIRANACVIHHLLIGGSFITQICSHVDLHLLSSTASRLSRLLLPTKHDHCDLLNHINSSHHVFGILLFRRRSYSVLWRRLVYVGVKWMTSYKVRGRGHYTRTWETETHKLNSGTSHAVELLGGLQQACKQCPWLVKQLIVAYEVTLSHNTSNAPTKELNVSRG